MCAERIRAVRVRVAQNWNPQAQSDLADAVFRCHRSVDGMYFESVGNELLQLDGYFVGVVSEGMSQGDESSVLSHKSVQIGIGPLGILKRGIVKAQDQHVLTVRGYFNAAKDSERSISVVQFFQPLKWHKTVMIGKDYGIQARRNRGANLLLF